MRNFQGLIWKVLLGSMGTLYVLAPMAPGENSPMPLQLVVKDQATEDVYWCMGVDEGDEVAVEFLHSYERFPLREEYSIEGPKKIKLVRILSRSMLNGQGFWSGKLVLGGDGWAEIAGWETLLERIEFIMGSPHLANHRLILRGRAFPLSNKIVPGTQVAVEVQEGECKEE